MRSWRKEMGGVSWTADTGRKGGQDRVEDGPGGWKGGEVGSTAREGARENEVVGTYGSGRGTWRGGGRGAMGDKRRRWRIEAQREDRGCGMCRWGELRDLKGAAVAEVWGVGDVRIGDKDWNDGGKGPGGIG